MKRPARTGANGCVLSCADKVFVSNLFQTCFKLVSNVPKPNFSESIWGPQSAPDLSRLTPNTLFFIPKNYVPSIARAQPGPGKLMFRALWSPAKSLESLCSDYCAGLAKGLESSCSDHREGPAKDLESLCSHCCERPADGPQNYVPIIIKAQPGVGKLMFN